MGHRGAPQDSNPHLLKGASQKEALLPVMNRGRRTSDKGTDSWSLLGVDIPPPTRLRVFSKVKESSEKIKGQLYAR